MSEQYALQASDLTMNLTSGMLDCSHATTSWRRSLTKITLRY